jgi:hypothetical protein
MTGIYIGQEFIDVPPMRNVARKLYTDASMYVSSLYDVSGSDSRRTDTESSDHERDPSRVPQQTVSETIESAKKHAGWWFWGSRK